MGDIRKSKANWQVNIIKYCTTFPNLLYYVLSSYFCLFFIFVSYEDLTLGRIKINKLG